MKRKHDNGFPSRDAIVAFVRANPGKIGTREIAREFGLKNADRIELKRILRELADEGAVAKRGRKIHEPATLPPDLEHSRGTDRTEAEAEAFDERVLLGKCCPLNITLSEKKKAKVTTLMRVPRNADGSPAQLPDQVNESLWFSLDEGQFDAKVFEKLTQWVQGKIKASPEWKAIQRGPGGADERAPAIDDAGGQPADVEF